MHEFRKNTGRYPNVVFISKEKRREFLEMFRNSFTIDVYSPVGNFLGDITICGIRVRWTENIDGVDWIEEFNDIDQQQKFAQQQYEYFNKLLKPLTQSKPIKIKSNKRKIIL